MDKSTESRSPHCPVEPSYLTNAEAAKRLRLSPRTLEAYRVRGGGPRFIKHGGAKSGLVLYRPADLDAWVESKVRNSTSDIGPGVR